MFPLNSSSLGGWKIVLHSFHGSTPNSDEMLDLAIELTSEQPAQVQVAG